MDMPLHTNDYMSVIGHALNDSMSCFFLFLILSIDPSRKKSKKKKRKSKDTERSSGDSDNQVPDGCGPTLLMIPDNTSLSHSGIEADSESQGSQDSKTEDLPSYVLEAGDSNVSNKYAADMQVCAFTQVVYDFVSVIL